MRRAEVEDSAGATVERNTIGSASIVGKGVNTLRALGREDELDTPGLMGSVLAKIEGEADEMMKETQFDHLEKRNTEVKPRETTVGGNPVR